MSPLDEIREILWPDGDREHEWSVSDLERIAEVLDRPPQKLALNDLPHPMQPVGLDHGGTIRFKKNEIVDFLLTCWAFDLNKLAWMQATGRFSEEDYTHLMQLIGYSVSGYSDLSTSPDHIVDAAFKAAGYK